MIQKKLLQFLALILLFAFPVTGQVKDTDAKIELLTQSHHFSIRSLRVVNDSVIWVGGSNGYVGRTTDGGKNWHWTHPGNDQLDFRSLAAFDANKAVVANAGSPAYIFLTDDGGAHWKKVYTNADSAIFLDGMVFRNDKQGIVYGDPIDGHFVILKTKDGGRHWKMQPLRRRPVADSGEASFAASNTAIFALPHSRYLWIATGGATARLHFSKNFGKRWTITHTPVLQGKSSAGIFSLAFIDKQTGICVGGDYLADTVRLQNAVLTRDGGETWQKPIINPYGYRSCVAYFSPDTVLATGTSGTDISKDGGVTWQKLTDEGFNVISISPKPHRKIILAGADGRIARLEFSTKYKGETGSGLKDKE